MNAILTLIVAATAAAAVPAKAPEAPGQALFAKKCSACHGKDGKGSAAMAKMFKAKPEELNLTTEEFAKKDDADATKVIVEGKNKMPAFKGKLKEAEIADVLSYIRSLVAKPEAKPDAEKK